MRDALSIYFSILCICWIHCTLAAPPPTASLSSVAAFQSPSLQRHRRQFDLTISADHDDKDDETELALEAIAGLWRSEDQKTQIEGSAKVVHRTNTLQSGNTHYTAKVHIRREYKKK